VELEGFMLAKQLFYHLNHTSSSNPVYRKLTLIFFPSPSTSPCFISLYLYDPGKATDPPASGFSLLNGREEIWQDQEGNHAEFLCLCGI
jgi:hypothetical protein